MIATTDRPCPRCGTSLEPTASPLARYCSSYCRGMAWHEAHHTSAPTRTVRERFDANVAEPDERGCTVWTAANFGARGYGAFWLDGRTRAAHRVSYELTHGPIPAGQLVRHKCDNRLCVNPDHLEVGTYRDNAHDAMSRGRWPGGEHHPRARLTDEQVREIRRLYASGGVTQRALAAEYDCTQSHISQLVRGALRRAA